MFTLIVSFSNPIKVHIVYSTYYVYVVRYKVLCIRCHPSSPKSDLLKRKVASRTSWNGKFVFRQILHLYAFNPFDRQIRFRQTGPGSCEPQYFAPPCTVVSAYCHLRVPSFWKKWTDFLYIVSKCFNSPKICSCVFYYEALHGHLSK